MHYQGIINKLYMRFVGMCECVLCVSGPGSLANTQRTAHGLRNRLKDELCNTNTMTINIHAPL